MSADQTTPEGSPAQPEATGGDVASPTDGNPPGAGGGKVISRREGLSTGAKIGIGVGALAVAGGGALAAFATGLVNGHGLSIKVNGKEHQVTSDPNTPLLYVLRDELGMKGLRFGCGFAQCGACAVQVDNVQGRAIRSCQTKVSAVSGRSITTLEGMGTADKPNPLQQAFIDQQAAQCGYCTAGMMAEAAAFLKVNPAPSAAQIKVALAGHLCRCGTHYRIVRAVQQAAGTLPAGSVPVTTLYEETQGL